MSLVSVEFLVFCTLVFVIYYLVRDKYRWIILLIASMVFYAWVGSKYLLYIVGNATVSFFAAKLIEKKTNEQNDYLKLHKEELGKEEKKAYKATIKKKQKLLLFLCVLINVGLLITVKYLDTWIAYFNYYRLLLTGNRNLVPQLGLILPLGISFYTLQSLGYVIDVFYNRVKAEKNYFHFLLFISFFPQILQGPISRFSQLKTELFRKRVLEISRISSGLFRIGWGLFKKLVIADRLAPYVLRSAAFREDYKGPYLLLCIFFYAFEIYADFSGGIDVAIGVAQLFGIKLPENFIRPFFAKSIAEYWRRWHITLGTWFRDYVFYPMSVNKTILNLSKWCRTHLGEGVGKRVPIYLPMIVVWMLTGLWHGAEGKFIVWGLCNCFFLILGTEFEPLSKWIMGKLSLREDMTIVKLYRIVKTFWLMSFLRVFDFVRTPKEGFQLMRDVFVGWDRFDINEIYTTLLLPQDEMIVALIAITVVAVVSTLQRKGPIRERILQQNAWVRYAALMVLMTVTLIFGSYGLGFDAQSFIYMKF